MAPDVHVESGMWLCEGGIAALYPDRRGRWPRGFFYTARLAMETTGNVAQHSKAVVLWAPQEPLHTDLST